MVIKFYLGFRQSGLGGASPTLRGPRKGKKIAPYPSHIEEDMAQFFFASDFAASCAPTFRTQDIIDISKHIIQYILILSIVYLIF